MVSTSCNSTINENNNIKGSILKQLLNTPTVDSRVLKHVYQFINHNPQNLEIFLETWKQVYFSAKLPLFEKLLNKFYDIVDCHVFEQFLNRKTDIYSEAKAELKRLIKMFHLNYMRSDCLDISSLEKMLTLLIIREVMPPNFFPIFNYACSKECEIRELKSQTLGAIFDLQVLGYDPETDRVFLSL